MHEIADWLKGGGFEQYTRCSTKQDSALPSRRTRLGQKAIAEVTSLGDLMGAVYRLAKPKDASGLYDIRRRSILELAPPTMPRADAQAWASQLTLAGMERKLRKLEVWVAELDGVIVGWGAIRGDRLEGLYAAPEFAGQGIGAGLLDMLEGLMRAREFPSVRAEASSNARDFYLRRGYRETGPQTPQGAWPIAKELLT